VLEGHNPEVAQIVAHFLAPILARGRASGELREDVTDEQIVSWIRAVYSAFILREEVDRDHIREMMATFLLPSLSAPAR
jgi:hypothetical protein